MASVSCPSCFALVRSPGVRRFRGFLSCAACGHRFLASIDDADPTRKKRVAATQAIPTEEIVALLAGDEEDGDATRESTAHVSTGPDPRGQAQLRMVGSDRVVSLDRFRLVIGRAGADLAIDDPAISREHAVIENHSDRFLLKDLGSTNGTYLNGRKVTVEFLQEGDTVQIGKMRLRFEHH